ncbi:MAG: hypothetical protein ACYSRQ_07360, partial [Planctomycetota bacterium]
MSPITKAFIMLVAVASVLLCGIVINFVASTENFQKSYDDLKRTSGTQIQKLDGQVKQLNDTLSKLEQEKNSLNTQIANLTTENEQSKIALSNSERERAAAQLKVDNWASIVQDFQKTNEQHSITLEN